MPHRRHAFTLIELMIALTLSMMVLYTAFAAFRVVGQSVTTCKRLSLENGMLRSGYFAALHELDFWDMYDDRSLVDPANPAAVNVTTNPLRANGKPFAPLTYDPTRTPSDPRTWWRGLGFAEDAPQTMKWGNYALLSRAMHDDQVRTWYPDQIKSIYEKIGVYGMLSYMPGNAIFSWYTSTGNAPLVIGGAPNKLERPRDIWERTDNTKFPQTSTVNGAAYDQGTAIDLLPRRPAHWPGLRVEARRYVVWSSFIDLCQVEVQSPLSGQPLRLSFWGVGTSLRGARQQRSLDKDVTLVVPP